MSSGAPSGFSFGTQLPGASFARVGRGRSGLGGFLAILIGAILMVPIVLLALLLLVIGGVFGIAAAVVLGIRGWFRRTFGGGGGRPSSSPGAGPRPAGPFGSAPRTPADDPDDSPGHTAGPDGEGRRNVRVVRR